MALARYRAVTSAAVWPRSTWIPAAIGTRAVAMSELLMGLRAEPRYSGAVNRQLKERSGSTGAAVVEGLEADIRILRESGLEEVGEPADQRRGGVEGGDLLVGEV